MRAFLVFLALFGAAASARFPSGTCTKDHVENVRKLLMAGFATLHVKEELPLRDVNDPAFSLSAGNLLDFGSFHIGEDVKSFCEANDSVTDFVAVAPRVRGHYTWRSRGNNPVSGELVVEAHEATFTGRLRQDRGDVRSVSLSFSHFHALSVHLSGMSSFSMPAAKMMTLANRAFNKAVRKTTKDVLSPALKRALRAGQ